MHSFILFFFLLKKYGLASRFVVPRFPQETGASKLLFWLLCCFYLGRQDTFCVCGFFLFPFSMYVCQKESRERQWVVGGLSGFFCVASASQHYAIHSDSFSSLSPAWDWGGFVLNGDLPLATYCKKQGQRERRGNRPSLLCMKMARSRDL
jgi:hypothetical protein